MSKNKYAFRSLLRLNAFLAMTDFNRNNLPTIFDPVMLYFRVE
ncbi:hypothetical protein EMIT0P100_120184 [Pseudomonas sp. IT-P100]